MKILQVIHGYPMRYNAGSEVYTQTLCRGLAEHHEVHVFTREEDPFAPDFRVRAERDADDPRIAQAPRVRASATYLSERMHEVPVLVIPCIEGRVEQAGVSAQAGLYGSILPATWSLMLALRARGLGTAWTTLHLVYEREAAAILDIPDDVTQVALIPVAYFRGTDFRPAKRLPGRDRTHWNTWDTRR